MPSWSPEQAQPISRPTISPPWARPLASLFAREERHDATASEHTATLTSLVLGLVGVVLAIGIALLLSRRIVGGIRQMLAAAEALAAGDLDQHVDVRSRDEVGAMARAFTKMIEYRRSPSPREVRKLAEESQKAAASIGDLVHEIRSETDRAVVAVEHGAHQTSERARTVTAAREAFARIRENVDSMTSRIEQIAVSSAQIVDSSEQMKSSVSSVAGVAEQCSASAEQVSAATEQTSASTQQIAASAQNLSLTAVELKRLVEQFTFR